LGSSMGVTPRDGSGESIGPTLLLRRRRFNVPLVSPKSWQQIDVSGRVFASSLGAYGGSASGSARLC